MKKLLVILVSVIGLNAMAQDHPKVMNVLAVNGLNMRSQPDGNARVVTKVAFGKSVEVLEKTNVELQLGWIKDHWYKVRFRGREGYIFGGYLSALPAPMAEATTTMAAEMLVTYCANTLKQEGETLNATERLRNGDTLYYSLLKFQGGAELELETQGDRSSAKLLLNTSVQSAYVLLEALLKSNGQAEMLDGLRFVKGKDGLLSRISNAESTISIRQLSDELTELKLTSYTADLSQN